MKRHLTLLILLFGLLSFANSQPNVDVDEMLGFACFYGGTQSKSVKKVSILIDEKKYDSIIELLDSKNKAEQYLAVIVIEKLDELDEIQLKNKQKDKISKLYSSKKKVSVCSGCIYWDKLTLESILKKNNKMRIPENYWLDNKISSK